MIAQAADTRPGLRWDVVTFVCTPVAGDIMASPDEKKDEGGGVASTALFLLHPAVGRDAVTAR